MSIDKKIKVIAKSAVKAASNNKKQVAGFSVMAALLIFIFVAGIMSDKKDDGILEVAKNTPHNEIVKEIVLDDAEDYTVASQEDLEKVLSRNEIKDVIIASTAEEIFTIPEGDYSGKSLFVDVPNGDVYNYGKFDQVTIKDVKSSTYYEYAQGNIILVYDEDCNINLIGNPISVSALSGGKININLNDVVSGFKIIVNNGSEVIITGASNPGIKVDIEDSASKVTTNVPLEITVKDTQGAPDILLLDGAENTVIKVNRKSQLVGVENRTNESIHYIVGEFNDNDENIAEDDLRQRADADKNIANNDLVPVGTGVNIIDNTSIASGVSGSLGTSDSTDAHSEESESSTGDSEQSSSSGSSVEPATGRLPESGPWLYGGILFTAEEVAHFHALWDYTGDAAEMASHHSASELLQVCIVDGFRGPSGNIPSPSTPNVPPKVYPPMAPSTYETKLTAEYECGQIQTGSFIDELTVKISYSEKLNNNYKHG